MEASKEELYTYDDVANLLQLSKGTIYRLVRDGELTPIKLTRKATRFLREDIAKYIENHRLSQGTLPSLEIVEPTSKPMLAESTASFVKEGVRLYAKDARDMSELTDGEVHLVVTSPPYWNAIDYDVHVADSNKWYRTRKGDEYQVYLAWLNEIMREVWRVTAPGAFCCIVVGTVLYEGKHYPLPSHLVGLMENIGFQFHQDIIWHKVTGGVKRAGVTIQKPYPGYYYPNIMTEYILIFRKSGGRKFNRISDDKVQINDLFTKEIANNVWHIAPVPPNHLPHPCPFPEEIPQRLTMFYSEKGDLVLDPFMGIGTTLKVARALGRRAVGYDIKQEYVQAAKRLVMAPLNIRDPLIGVFPNLSKLQQLSLTLHTLKSTVSRGRRSRNKTRRG